MRPLAAGLIASPAARMSFSDTRAKEQTVLVLMVSAMARMASKSPGLAAAKPASITSTRRRSNWRAMRIFSSLVMDAPGLCSPSRKVVSKIIKRSVMMFFLCSKPSHERLVNLKIWGFGLQPAISISGADAALTGACRWGSCFSARGAVDPGKVVVAASESRPMDCHGPEGPRNDGLNAFP